MTLISSQRNLQFPEWDPGLRLAPSRPCHVHKERFFYLGFLQALQNLRIESERSREQFQIPLCSRPRSQVRTTRENFSEGGCYCWRNFAFMRMPSDRSLPRIAYHRVSSGNIQPPNLGLPFKLLNSNNSFPLLSSVSYFRLQVVLHHLKPVTGRSQTAILQASIVRMEDGSKFLQSYTGALQSLSFTPSKPQVEQIST